jgi:conjugal transfer pilus assembly protein TraB
MVFAMGSATGPAKADETVGAPSSANLGTAMPSDKFIQSFQQQLSAQLQNALDQSNHDQDARLQALTQQQGSLQAQLAGLQQALDTARGGAAARNDIAPPSVHAHGEPEASTASTSDAITAGTERPGRHANVAPNGFIEGRLLNGVVTVVGGPDRESIVLLTGPYHAANGFRVQLDGCHALVQGHPDIAAGRIDFKLSRLTCNFPDGASRTWDTAGWLVDDDGIRGLRATLVENLGRKAAVAAAGGAIAGLGQRLSQEQYQLTTSVGGVGGTTSNSTFVGSGAADAVGGAASGAAAAIGQSLGDYYNLFAPSLQVGGGTSVTVVLANDLRVPRSGQGLTPTFAAP